VEYNLTSYKHLEAMSVCGQVMSQHVASRPHSDVIIAVPKPRAQKTPRVTSQPVNCAAQVQHQ
jgi:microcompartment protein CcmL/EutN